MSTFNLSILAAERAFYVGACESLIVPTVEGQYGILANHTNMISAVVNGILEFRIPGGEMQPVVVSDGMVKVEDNDVLVLVDTAERPEEIDAIVAQLEADQAKEALLQQRSMQEYYLAQADLSRALNKLKVKNKYSPD